MEVLYALAKDKTAAYKLTRYQAPDEKGYMAHLHATHRGGAVAECSIKLQSYTELKVEMLRQKISPEQYQVELKRLSHARTVETR